MLRFILTLFLGLTAIVNAGTFGECSCKFKDGHVQKFQVSDCKASACYIECRQNAGGIQESCVTKNEDSIKLPGPGRCQCGKGIYDVASCDSDECFNLCDKQHLGHGVCVTKTNALAIALTPTISDSSAMSCDACFAKFADLPADDQAKICNKVLKCVPVTPQPTTVAPKVALAVIQCDKCLAKLADDIPADDAQFLCNKVLKCKPAPTVTQVLSELAGIPCDKCQAELTEKNVPADDAAFICKKVIKCTAVQAMAGGDGANLG